MTPDPRPTLAAPDHDPWLWLEEIDGEDALAWVVQQNATTFANLADARFAADRAAVKALLDRPDKLAHIVRRGHHLYNFWQDADHPRGVWRRTTLESYRGSSSDWEVLLDLDALALAENKPWVWLGAVTLPGSHARAMLHLSAGGGDAVHLREFDLETRGFVPDGFVLPEAKGSMAWLDQDSLILSSAFGEGMATRSGYARCVRLWRRGEEPAEARILFAGDESDMAIWGDVDREAPGRLAFFRKPSFFATESHLGDLSGPCHRLDLPEDAEARWSRGWLVVRPRSPWLGHAADTLLAIRLEDFLDGNRDFTVLSTPSPRRALSGFFWSDGRLVVTGLDELRPVFSILTPSPEGWSRAELPGLPGIGVAQLWSLDMEEEESDGTLLVQCEDPLQPPALLLTSTLLATPTLLKQASPAFAAPGLVVTRHEAISVDGERIPYVQTGPAGLTGEAPVHLGGYGGFRISRLPSYQGVIGKLWLEKGGTSVVANIRGGGEFGTRWHEAALREKRHLAHDDFAAVAADLVRRGVTRPGRIAAEGGSNGGLLIANMLTRYPERFGALFCTVPLIDMRRFPQLLAGASWIAEYGDPAVPEDWAFMQHFSAYHTAEPGRPYPPILLATRRRDDRVHPGHARKMAAKLQAMGYPALFHEPGAGGHGVATDNGEAASFAALGAAFLRRAIGWEAPLA